MIHTGMEFGWT